MNRVKSIFAALFLFNALVQAAETPSENLLAVRLADSLMIQQRFREAELEYERYATLHPEDPARRAVLQKMFDASMATEDYRFVLKLTRAWENQLQGVEACLPPVYEARALYRLENYSSVLKQTMPAACSGDLLNETFYWRGLSHLRMRQWPEARQEFNRIPQDSALHAQALRAVEKSMSGPAIPRKSPGLAAGLNAALPGAGYAYAHRPQTAVACGIVNGLFIWGTVASVHAKEPGLAALLSLFSFTWYWGGVYGAAQSAQKETESQLASWIEPLELNH